MWNPLSWAMEAAAIIAIALLDYADFALIVALLLVNSTISYVEEANADKAIKALASGECRGAAFCLARTAHYEAWAPVLQRSWTPPATAPDPRPPHPILPPQPWPRAPRPSATVR